MFDDFQRINDYSGRDENAEVDTLLAGSDDALDAEEDEVLNAIWNADTSEN